MKRQRSTAGSAMKAAKCEGDQDYVRVLMDGTGTTVNMTKKKKRQQVQKVKEEGKVGEVEIERRDAGEPVVEVATATEIGKEWEEWPWSSGMVDEQMSWGSCWLPHWGVEFMGDAYNVLYGDVAWDDDIWDLKGVKEIPNP
ncbi:hypothetical protein L1049_006751 [Liquidambar formosana]|uniref:Uncharacterized protein n=1 Tax=Liquidambar formosana TaxID=63359 RepID=A0AAP0RG47_LIQFO